MNIIVVGNGGRENAIIRSLAKSYSQLNIYGLGDYLNPDILPLLKGFRLLEKFDMDDAVTFIKKLNPRFVVIGPEKYLELGLTDRLIHENIPTIGSSSFLSKIETSKLFCRELLLHNNLSRISPKYFVVDRVSTYQEINKILSDFNDKIVVKPDGLTGGKGVKLFNNQRNEAHDYIREVLINDEYLVLEELLEGEEFIQLSFCDGKNIVHCPVVKDFKKLSINDNINTGSMGCIIQKDEKYQNVRKEHIMEGKQLNKQVMDILSSMDNYGYRGILYGSYMSTSNGIKLIEYNARFGDPEGILVLEALNTSLFEIFDAITTQSLNKLNVNFSNKYGLCKYLVPQGYPYKPEKYSTVNISGLNKEQRENTYLAGIISRIVN